MPNRIIREAILSSELVATLKWDEEVFYRRLMSIVDDYGRYEANPQLLRSRCYPLQTDNVRVADISRWMAACQKAGLILDYVVDGRRYLEINKFQQQLRSASKYPTPTASDINCNHLLADAHLGVSVSEGVSVNVSVTPVVPTGDEAAILSAYHSILPNCKKVAVLNPKRKKRIAAAVKLAKQTCTTQGWPYDANGFWLAYFGECAKDPWMRGDVPYKDNPNWKQGLETLIAEDRFAGVMDSAIASMRSHS